MRTIIWRLFGPKTVGEKFRRLARRAAAARPDQSHVEQVVHEIWWLIAETENGSLHQYLANSTGDSFHETLGYLGEVGAVESQRILLKLASAAFPGGIVPADRDERCSRFLPWADQIPNEQWIGRLTDEFLATQPQLMEKVVAYAEDAGLLSKSGIARGNHRSGLVSRSA